MLNKNKVREILRAKQGSQVSKLYNGDILRATNIPNMKTKLKAPEWDYNATFGMKMQKFGTLYGGTINAVSQGVDAARGMLFGNLAAKNSQLTNTLNSAYDATSSALMSFTPIGTIAGGAMKVGAFIGDGLAAMGIGTDQMTTTDLILDSNLMKLTPVGLVNSIGAKKTLDFSANLDTIEQVGGSYGGTVSDINAAVLKSGKKYGLFSSGSRRKANKQINQAREKQNIMTNITNEATDLRAMINDINYLNYDLNLSGGYDLRYMRAAKSGMKIQDKIDFIKLRRTINNIINLDTKEIEWEPETIIFKTGGTITQDWDIIFELPVKQFEEGGKIRTLEELIKYAKELNPRFVQRLSEEPRGIKFIDDEGNEAEGTHYLESRGEYVIPRIQEINGELKFLSPQEAIDRAIESGNYLKMLPEEAIIFAENYKQGWPEFFNKFKEGGKTKEELETPEIEETSQKNLIPEGALHKNKHHMEHTEGLTLKGIPVIDNDREQQAEIELDEIIFTLEVTKKLEELYKEGTDEAAIEAGKLLVKEILFNTDDRTGLISKCEKGGKL